MIGNSGGIHRTRRKVILLPRKWIIGFVALVAVFAGALGVASVAQATSGSPHKVTICHRTDSETNPYVKIPVDSASVDGNVGNDHGKGDHYAEHKGTVWFPGHTKEPKWGDIIPPFYSNGTPDGLPSLNWSTAGQAIFYNDCKPVTIPPTTTTTTTHTTPPTTKLGKTPGLIDSDGGRPSINVVGPLNQGPNVWLWGLFGGLGGTVLAWGGFKLVPARRRGRH